MYTDDREKTGLPIKTFLLSLILIIIFILLLMWLLPMPNSSKNSGNGNSNDSSGLAALTNRIFNANIQEMKSAGILYFTKDKLPNKAGETVTLTLQEMLDKKLLLPFTDKNGDACDTAKSYVSLTKKDDGYEMKVNLKCGDQEDYILTYLGCYEYCTSAICEKKEDNPTPTPKPSSDSPYCTLYVSSGKAGSNGWYIGDAVVSFKSKGTQAKGATITTYGLGTSSSTNYNKANSYTVKNDGSTTVYGYVKDSNGKTATCKLVVKKDTANPSCSLTVLSGSKAANGDYTSNVVIGFSSKTDATSGIVAFGLTNSTTASYNSATKYTVTTNGTHKIYGYVKDAAGHTAKCDITVKRNYQESSSKPSCSLKITNGTTGSNGWYTGNVTIGFASKTSTNGATIKSFGIGTTETYSGNESYTVNNDGTSTVYGYVKDSNGNTATCSIVVKKDNNKPSCKLKVTSGTYNNAGYYTSDITIGFDSKVDSTSGIAAYGIGTTTTYSGNTSYKVTQTGTTTVYGYVKDGAGNAATCSIKVEKRNGIEYLYTKNIPTEYSNWSNWETNEYKPENPPKFGSYPLVEMVDLGKTRVVEKYIEKLGDPIYKYETVRIGTATQKYCKGYKYYRETNSTTTYAVKENEQESCVKVSLSGWPTDSITTKYTFLGYDWNCIGCEQVPKTVWRKCTKNVGVVTSSNTITTSNIKVECKEVETKEVEIFSTIKVFVDYLIERTPVYRDKYQFKARTRTIIKEAYVHSVWSYPNDQSLLNAGYTMTNEYRIVG